MAPVNGATGKPSKGPGSRIRPVHKPVVPVVPITYPQRSTKPAATASAAAAEDAPVAPHRQLADKAGVEEKVEHTTELHEPKTDHNRHNGVDGQVPEIVSPETPDVVTPYAAPAQTAEAPPSSSTISIDKAGPSPQTSTSRLPTAFEPAHGNSTADSTQAAVSASSASHTQPPMADRIADHQAHPSNGSVMFGAFPGSGTSSPAPHPPVGFPPVTAPPFHGAQPVPVDIYGRPIMVSPTNGDGFVHVVNNHHGPPTPHSFHGSQASTQPEELNGFGPRPVNGHGNYPAELPAQPQTQPYMNSHVPFINHQIQEEALGVIRSGLKDAEFADCTLEFRFDNPDNDLREPLKMAVHRLVIAHSPTLRHLLRSRGGLLHGVLQLDIRDEYMRTDALYFAIRTLYGWDLGDGPHLPTYSPLINIVDDLNLALGYIAAARYLQLPLVHMKAVHWASRLVRWETVELACKFALPIAALGPPTRHGLPSPRDEYSLNELLDSIVAFLFNNIPSDYILDIHAGDCGFPRLPLVTSAPPTPLSPDAPAIAHGTSGSTKTHMPRNQRMSVNPRLTQIKFGDIGTSSGGEHGSQPGTPVYTRRPPTQAETILSRILLNLPFNLLKQTLEHPVFAKNAAADGITRAIVAERESRRLRAVDRNNTELRGLQDAMERAGKPLLITQPVDFLVNNMGFKEEVFAGDAPYLVQTWSQGPSSAGSVSSS